MSKTIRVLIDGLGNANLPMVDLMVSEAERLESSFGIRFQIVGAADSKGAAFSSTGIPAQQIARVKKEQGTVAKIPELGRPGMTMKEVLQQCDADIFVEGLPPFLPSGEPGFSNIIAAMSQGMHVVSANKAPFALYWGELFAYAKSKNVMVRYGAAASAGLMTLEMGAALGRCGELLEMTGIFNASTMYVIQKMKEGTTFEEAVKGAREGGFLEPDPSMDIDGWDSAMKTVIQANTYWDKAYTLSDVEIHGIRDLSPEDIRRSQERGEVWCMIGSAVQEKDGGLKLWVGPKSIPAEHPVAKARWCDKILYLKTRSQGEQVHSCLGASASGTAGNIFLDMILIAREIAKK